MAATDQNITFEATGSHIGLGALFASFIGTYAAWRDARDTHKSLSSLTDRELDDIGLCRGDIDLISGRY
ncbi:DUF1127 domain-containing protein [Pelagimonas varians]|uniref:YjiS-like domain-containing protein n=1 Tax=Pelagimonas varians TaxID=696760 RepID=A0A238KRX4_9RHOB|nr:DUF1127 domain-containing protein [Pelagimonas varians]PYG28615.1 uncharacterized protein YjiS (DUF1127 family) [Pelagimonas varians]SMX45410.1 hypothetical protein PEV8663_03036 [Pelagimonas varians]